MDGVGIQVSVILAGTKKNGEACGDFDRTMCPVFRCSSMKALDVSIS